MESIVFVWFLIGYTYLATLMFGLSAGLIYERLYGKHNHLHLDTYCSLCLKDIVKARKRK